jgi:hypothetical protein
MSVFGWLNDNLLRMTWLNDLVGAGVAAVGLDPSSRIGGSVQFFVYDVIKIFILLSVRFLRFPMSRAISRPNGRAPCWAGGPVWAPTRSRPFWAR